MRSYYGSMLRSMFTSTELWGSLSVLERAVNGLFLLIGVAAIFLGPGLSIPLWAPVPIWVAILLYDLLRLDYARHAKLMTQLDEAESYQRDVLAWRGREVREHIEGTELGEMAGLYRDRVRQIGAGGAGLGEAFWNGEADWLDRMAEKTLTKVWPDAVPAFKEPVPMTTPSGGPWEPRIQAYLETKARRLDDLLRERGTVAGPAPTPPGWWPFRPAG